MLLKEGPNSRRGEVLELPNLAAEETGKATTTLEEEEVGIVVLLMDTVEAAEEAVEEEEAVVETEGAVMVREGAVVVVAAEEAVEVAVSEATVTDLGILRKMETAVEDGKNLLQDGEEMMMKEEIVAEVEAVVEVVAVEVVAAAEAEVMEIVAEMLGETAREADLLGEAAVAVLVVKMMERVTTRLNRGKFMYRLRG